MTPASTRASHGRGCGNRGKRFEFSKKLWARLSASTASAVSAGSSSARGPRRRRMIEGASTTSHADIPGASGSSFRTRRRTAFGSFASCHVTGFGSFQISIATNRSFLCASIPTYVVTCFMTGSLRCGLWCHVALTCELVALSTVLSAASARTLRWRAGHSILSSQHPR
jgi:hypothetical protein